MTQREKKPDLSLSPVTSEQLDAQAVVTDADIVEGNEKWREKSQGRDRDMLQAEDRE